MAHILFLAVMLTTLTHITAKPRICSSAYQTKHDCPNWHYCDTSNGWCRPCVTCGPYNRGGPSDTNNCRAPVACTYGGHQIVCPKLYARYTDTSLTQNRNNFLGTEANSSCFIPGNNSVVSATLRCVAESSMVHDNETGEEYKIYTPSWIGDATCVTEVAPTKPPLLQPAIDDNMLAMTKPMSTYQEKDIHAMSISPAKVSSQTTVPLPERTLQVIDLESPSTRFQRETLAGELDDDHLWKRPSFASVVLAICICLVVAGVVLGVICGVRYWKIQSKKGISRIPVEQSDLTDQDNSKHFLAECHSLVSFTSRTPCQESSSDSAEAPMVHRQESSSDSNVDAFHDISLSLHITPPVSDSSDSSRSQEETTVKTATGESESSESSDNPHTVIVPDKELTDNSYNIHGPTSVNSSRQNQSFSHIPGHFLFNDRSPNQDSYYSSDDNVKPPEIEPSSGTGQKVVHVHNEPQEHECPESYREASENTQPSALITAFNSQDNSSDMAAVNGIQHLDSSEFKESTLNQTDAFLPTELPCPGTPPIREPREHTYPTSMCSSVVESETPPYSTYSSMGTEYSLNPTSMRNSEQTHVKLSVGSDNEDDDNNV